MPFDTAQFVPASELVLLSPLFVKAAAWPELWDTLALPAPGEAGFPGEPAIADLNLLESPPGSTPICARARRAPRWASVAMVA